VTKWTVISQYSLLRVFVSTSSFAPLDLVSVITTGWCTEVVHQNDVLYRRGKGVVCVAVWTKPSVTLVQWWFHTHYGKETPMRKSVYKWHKSFAETCCICAKKKNAVDVHVTRLWSVLGNWVMSLTLQCGGCYVFLAIQISTAARVKAQWLTMSDGLWYWYAELPRTGQFVFGQNCFQWWCYFLA
jgi:hypothetical protein